MDDSKPIFLHLITDGRDVLPKTAKNFIKPILEICHQNIQVASLSGRFYAMDRDKRWERIKKAYLSIAKAQNKSSLSPLEYVDASYEQGIFDEFIEPASFGDFQGFEQEDGILFTNFRSDRAREMIMALNGEIEEIGAEICPHILTMTSYDKTFSHPVLFSKEDVKNTLAEIISKANLTQAHVAETEKYAHVTFFFNGGVEEPFIGESRALIRAIMKLRSRR